MAIPTVDTFEHDIAEEIRTKEASLTDIASAGGDVGNTRSSAAQTSNMLVILGIVFVVLVLGTIIAFFFFYNATPEIPPLTSTSATSSSNAQLEKISPKLASAIGSYVRTVSKSDYGYTLTLLSYSPVFSYMIKNESAYADELARTVGSPRDTGTSSPPFTFTDLTLSNQNMRVGVSGSSTVVYAFVNAQALVIASSPQGILALASAILK
jgi:hypothetical protein